MPPGYDRNGVTPPQYILKGVPSPINSTPVTGRNGVPESGFSPLGREVLDFEEGGRVLDVACDEKHGTIYSCGRNIIYQWDRKTGRLGKKPTQHKHVQLDYSNAMLIALAIPSKNSGGQVLGYSLSNKQRFLKTLGCIIPSSAGVTTSVAQQNERIIAAEWHQHQSPRIACYSFDGSLCREVGSYLNHKAAISVVEAHNNATMFTSADRIGRIATWDLRQQTPALILQQGDGIPVTATSACGTLLGCSNSKGEVKVFDMRKGNSLHQHKDTQLVGIPNSMSLTETGHLFVSSYEGIFELSGWLQGRSVTSLSDKSANSLRYSSESRAIVVGHSQRIQLYYPFLEQQSLLTSSALTSPSSNGPARTSPSPPSPPPPPPPPEGYNTVRGGYSSLSATSTPYFSSWSNFEQQQPLQPVGENVLSDGTRSDGDDVLPSPPVDDYPSVAVGIQRSPPTPPSYLLPDPSPNSPPTPPDSVPLVFPSLPKSALSGMLHTNLTVAHRLNYPSSCNKDTDIQSILNCINTDDGIQNDKVDTNTIDTLFVLGVGEGYQRLVGRYQLTGINEWNCCQSKMRIRRKGAIWFIADDATDTKLAEARSPCDHPNTSFEWYTRTSEGPDETILVTTSSVVFDLFMLLPPSDSLLPFRNLSHGLEVPNKPYSIDVSYTTLDDGTAASLMTFITRYRLQPSRIVFGQRCDDSAAVSEILSKGLPAKCTTVDAGHSQTLAMSCADELHQRGGGVLIIRIRDDDSAFRFAKQIRKMSELGHELEVKAICSSRVTWKGKAELEIDIDVPFSSIQSGVVVNIEDDLETQSSPFTVQLPEKSSSYTAETYHSCAAALIDLGELTHCQSDEKEAILQFVVAGASLKKVRIAFAQVQDGTADDLLMAVFRNPLLTSLEVSGDVDAFFDHIKRQPKSVVRRSSIKCLYLKGGSVLTPEVLEEIVLPANLLGLRQNVATSLAAPVLQQLLAFFRRGTTELSLLILGSIVSRKPWKPSTTLDIHMSAACAWKGLSDDCEFDSVSVIPTFDELPQQRHQPPSRVCSVLSSCQSVVLDISEGDVFDLLQSSGVPLGVCEMLRDEGIDGAAFGYLTDTILRDELSVSDPEIRSSILRARNNVINTLR